MASQSKQITVPQFAALKASGEKISMLTAYDATMAALLDTTGIEGILVGDSLGMVVQGRANTLPVTLGEMIYHGRMVARAVRHALVVVDMPFGSFHCGQNKAIAAGAKVLKRTGCGAVKLEGGVEQAGTIAALVSAGIPVMAHCGLRPQNVLQLGGYQVQRDTEQLMADAESAQQAGAFAIVLECIPEEIARRITETLQIPTIGIGAGVGCDGQILVVNDMIGLTPGRPPRHVRKFADVRTTIGDAVTEYRDAVRQGTFPGAEQTFQ